MLDAFAAAWPRLRSAAAVGREMGVSPRYAYALRRDADLAGMLDGAPVDRRLGAASRRSVQPASVQPDKPAAPAPADVLAEVRALRSRLARAESDGLTDEWVKAKLGSLAADCAKTPPPVWLVREPRRGGTVSVPTLFASDWHWGEVVDPAEINGVNAFNLEIAHQRARTMVERAVSLLRKNVAGAHYPGIVFALGGDMVSGDIHDELSQTNDVPMLPIVLDLVSVLAWAIKALADEFGAVFLPCVAGNHGRMTRKPRAKQRAHTNFDWLTYQLLASRFAGDKRVSFLIPDGPDASWRVFGVRYCLTHGDQFRGGDGMIGALGPVARGDKRKRSRNGQIDMGYDVLLMGHWHQLLQTGRFVVNGCFPSGSRVMTDNGYTPIERVSIGDSVMSKDGSKQQVTHVFERRADRLVGIKVTGLPDVIESTPNHLVWAAKRASATSDVPPSRRHLIGATVGPAQWVPMDFISPGDFVHVPFPKGGERPVDVETAWAYGLYLAEGSTLLDGGSSGRHNRVVLTMHERELDVLKRFAAWFGGAFPGSNPRVFTRTRNGGGKTSEFVVSPGRDVCAWFRETFGHGAAGKHLPDGALWWADDLKAAMVQGWVDGDGHSAAQNDCRPTVSATTISQELAWGMFHIAPALGVWPSLSLLRKGGRRKSDSYTVHLNVGQSVRIIGGEAFYQVSERFERDGNCQVFDLEVSGEHTYNVGGIGVHNSLKGYDEYANVSNFDFERAQQALWLTHPQHGITLQMPVHLQDLPGAGERAPWVSVAGDSKLGPVRIKGRAAR